ncbi:hypothetical protein EV127DRAFT_495319 [Xylaria flabelliformis]|nr:hypothetical protein EV127DRAFT_495319 [Xylaria flabelliformis]
MGLNESGEKRLAVVIVGVTVSTIAVVTRFWCKFALKTGLHADDWLILLTLVSYIGGQSAVLWGLFDGTGGREIQEIQAELLSHPSQKTSLFIGVTIVYFVLWTAKISICLFYRRVFPTPSFRRLSLLVMGIATAWFIGTEVANLAICVPIDIFWHRMKPGRCLNFNLFYLINGIAETIIDIVILALPVRAVFSVQIPTRTKFLVSGIFLLGGFVIVTNILRIYYSYQPDAQYITFTNSEIWTNVHITTAILCACLPTYKPLRAKVAGMIQRIRLGYASSRRRFFGYATQESSATRHDTSGPSGYQMNGIAVRKQESFNHSGPRPSDSAWDLLPTHGEVVRVVSGKADSGKGQEGPSSFETV